MTASDLGRTLNVFANPLVVRGARSRLRLAHLASWGLITVAFTTFVFLIVYLTGVERDIATPEASAKATLFPIIVVQGFILMLLGTGAVAGGLARERMADLLDYQRLTPMPPSAKIIGLLFGLPAREYFMFALTLPFVAYAAWVGDVPLGKLAQFYLVFFTSVWLYHMTGLVAGIVADKPWRATLQAQGLVVMLYLIIPQLSLVGFSFAEFLTVRPTFYAMVAEELQGIQRGPQAAWTALNVQRWQEFSFFEMSLNPILCSVVLQAFALVSLFIVVHRKWLDETRHAFSKPFAIVFFACVQFFVVGSLWPNLTDAQKFNALLQRLGVEHFPGAQLDLVWLIFFVLLGIAGALGVLLIHIVAPEAQTVVKGWRRARKRRERRLAWPSDAATSLPVTLAVVALAAVGYGLMLAIAERAGRLGGLDPSLWQMAAAPAYLAAVLLCVGFFRETSTLRMSLVGAFLLWAVPFFALLILLASRGDVVAAAYAGLPNPAVGVYATLSLLLQEGWSGADTFIVPDELAPHLPTLAAISVGGYAAGALALSLRWWLTRRRLSA